MVRESFKTIFSAEKKICMDNEDTFFSSRLKAEKKYYGSFDKSLVNSSDNKFSCTNPVNVLHKNEIRALCKGGMSTEVRGGCVQFYK